MDLGNFKLTLLSQHTEKTAIVQCISFQTSLPRVRLLPVEILFPLWVRPCRDFMYPGISSRMLIIIVPICQEMSKKSLEQHCPIELSVMMEIFYVHTAQCCSYSLQRAY